MPAFDRILIANRGEIALRIMRSARRLGFSTVAVYSDADREARHVREADAAVHIGAAPATQSYLDIAMLIEAARRSRAQAIHPGYGFASERAEFAQAVREAGLIFIGPTPEAMAAMGNKAAAKQRMLAAGVPCVPGYQSDGSEDAQSDRRLTQEALRIGLPVMIKAAAGGGGRGMRLIAQAEQLPAAIASARSEAQAAFGSGELLIEKAISAARHVEIQVFGDEQGEVVHFGERDCSAQRRHQKLVEEAPSPAVDEALRQRMGAAATAAARAVAYVGAGTVEFLLAADGQFYFLEMNTRLQVEHPVTEAVYGVDLVEWQLRVAQGERLPLNQEQILARRHGWAMEVRLCSEDPLRDFLPQTGRVLLWRAPDSGVRVESALEDGSVISPHYDSMQAKLIVHAESRQQARIQLLRALRETSLLGLASNRDYLGRILAHPAFASGDFNTGFIAQHLSSADQDPSAAPQPLGALAALCFYCDQARRLCTEQALADEYVGWHSSHAAAAIFRLGDGRACRELRVLRKAAACYDIGDGEQTWSVEVLRSGAPELRYVLDGIERCLRYVVDGRFLWLDAEGCIAVYEDQSLAPAAAVASGSDGCLLAHSDGRLAALLVQVGERVEKHQGLAVLEAMKLEFQLSLPVGGIVEAIEVQAGQQVRNRQLLVRVRVDS